MVFLSWLEHMVLFLNCKVTLIILVHFLAYLVTLMPIFICQVNLMLFLK